MISGIVLKEHPYVLRDDRQNPVEDQTVFFIIPKTVRSANETAAKYAAISQTDRRGETKVNTQRMNAVDIEVWCTAVQRVVNYVCPVGAPEHGYDYFVNKLPSGTDENDAVKKLPAGILVKTAETEEDRRMVFLTMCPDHTDEVMGAFYNYSALKEGLKND
jgi:hypothetical protein